MPAIASIANGLTKRTQITISFQKLIADMIAVALPLFAAINPDVSWDAQGDKWESLKLFCVILFCV